MTRPFVRGAGVAAISLATIALLGSPAFGEGVRVRCAGGGTPGQGEFGSLYDAMVYLDGRDHSQKHFVEIHGTCTESRPIVVSDYPNLDLYGMTDPAALQGTQLDQLLTFRDTTAYVYGLTIDAAAGRNAVVIQGGTVSITGSVIKNATWRGVVVCCGGQVNLGGTRIEEVGNTSLSVGSFAFAYLGPDSSDTTRESSITRESIGGYGIVADGGHVMVTSGTAIRGFNNGIRCHGGRVEFYSPGPGVALTNNHTGILAIGCYLSMNGPVRVSDNLLRGAYLSHSTLITQWGIGSQSIERNGDGRHPGIYVGNSSFVELDNGRIANNSGQGVLVDTSSTVSLRGAVVEGNSGYGIQVEDYSTIELQAAAPVSLIQANGGADVVCSSKSGGRGDSSGVARMKCSTFVTTK